MTTIVLHPSYEETFRRLRSAPADGPDEHRAALETLRRLADEVFAAPAPDPASLCEAGSALDDLCDARLASDLVDALDMAFLRADWSRTVLAASVTALPSPFCRGGLLVVPIGGPDSDEDGWNGKATIPPFFLVEPERTDVASRFAAGLLERRAGAVVLNPAQARDYMDREGTVWARCGRPGLRLRCWLGRLVGLGVRVDRTAALLRRVSHRMAPEHRRVLDAVMPGWSRPPSGG